MNDALVTEPLRLARFRLFWIARVATSVAFQMVGVAVGWQIYALTHSALALGMIGLAQFVPMVVLLLPVGHVADRYDRRTVARCCELVMALSCAVLALAAARDARHVGLIYAVVVLIGAARSFENPSLQALLPSLVPAPLLGGATARSASANQTAIVIGPAAGGLIYAIHPFAVYATAALLFGAAAAALSGIRAQRAALARPVPTLASLFAGIEFIRRQPVVLGAISLDLFAVLLGGATALLPIYARDIFHAGPWALGTLRAAPAVGALTMSLALSGRALRRRVGRAMFAAVTVYGLATIVFALSRSLAVSLGALVVLGAADVVSVVIRQSLVQIRTPDAMRGRVSAVNSLFIGTSNQLGEFESGVTAAWLGPVAATVLGGIGTIAVALLWSRLFRPLARADRLDDPIPAEPGPAA